MFDPLGEWLIDRAIKKAAITMAQAITAIVLAKSQILKSAGISMSVDPNALSVALIGLSEIVRHYMKQRFNISWL